MNKRPIIDAHHHLWDLDACNYPWLMARGVQRFFGDPTPIQKNYLVQDYREDASSYELLASVHVQVGVQQGDEVRESKWLQQQADRHGLPGAIVAYCDLSSRTAEATIRAHRQFDAFRGIRQIVGRSMEEDKATGSAGVLSHPRWRENLAMLARYGCSFDLQLIPAQMSSVTKILANSPELPVALCHCGSPWNQSAAGIKSWRSALAEFASLPNVYCKISGLGMFDHDWTTTRIRPIVESCIEVFGANRCMFGSNFPVDKLHASFDKVWSAFEEVSKDLTVEDQDSLFVTTAKSFYRL